MSSRKEGKKETQGGKPRGVRKRCIKIIFQRAPNDALSSSAGQRAEQHKGFDILRVDFLPVSRSMSAFLAKVATSARQKNYKTAITASCEALRRNRGSKRVSEHDILWRSRRCDASCLPRSSTEKTIFTVSIHTQSTTGSPKVWCGGGMTGWYVSCTVCEPR